ncbi:putative signal transduction histidine-protein kinase [Rhypophila sp. PSN 637]
MVPRDFSSGDHSAMPHNQDGLGHDPDPEPDARPPTPPYILSPTPTSAHNRNSFGRPNCGEFKDSLTLPQTGGNRFVRDTPVMTPGVARDQSASPFRLAMPSNSPGQLALSAMQFLPLPVLVLDNFKTVALANEAMGRLLGTGTGMGSQNGSDDSESMVSVMDLLRGQTLSQVGIDLIQDNGPVWIEWEQFLDQVASEMGAAKTTDSTKSVPLVNGNNDIFADTTDCPSPNAAVEVVISKRDFGRRPLDARVHSKRAEPQTYAKMIISPWQLDDRQTYFTLTFTFTEIKRDSPQPAKSYTSNPQTMELTDARFTSNASGPPSQSSNYSHDSRSPSYIVSPSSVSLSSSPFPPLGPPQKSSISSSPSMLQKSTVIKDALLDNTQTPILAMWKDGSVTFPNRAARELFNPNADLGMLNDGFDLLPAWTLWDENFTKQLELDEYPISVLLRTEKPFTGFRIGMLDREGKRLIFDVEGSAITDEHTGEFLAGVVTCRDVTKLTEEINNIKEADAERFKLICDTMPQLVWTARPDGSHDFFNSRWYSYTGLSEEESLGEGWGLPFHPDDMAETQSRWQHSLQTGEPYMIEYRCRRNDGAWRWFLGRALPLRNKKTGEIEQWFGTCTDVHESIEAKLEASRTRQQLLSVMAHSQMTMFTVDLDGKVTMLEGALIWESQGPNHNSKWYIGEDVYDVFNRLNSQLPQGQMPPFLKPLESVLAGLESDEIQEHEMDGRWYRTRLQPLVKKSGEGDTQTTAIEGVIGLIMDVTELKAKERDIEAREREKRKLVAAEAAAKEASRLKSQFLANMSHEIRTPITGVIGMAELLLDHELPEEPRELSENIYRSANALLTVINDILDFSKVESGRLDIEEVRFSLSVIIRDVLKMLSFAADKKSLAFQSNISTDIDADLVVLGDPGRVRQIITNLLTNSIKFTNQGYVKFSVMIEKEDAEQIEVRFSVEDTGIGIEEGVRTRLFVPFSQGDSSTARRFGGTGLGLTISKNLLDLMHGRITLESTLGTGTTATFWIPFKRPQGVRKPNLVQLEALPDRLQAEMSVSCHSSEFEQIVGTPPGELTGSPLDKNRTPWRNPSISSSNIGEDDLQAADRANIHILVVEDNAINQQIAIKTIRKLGFQVTAAWNGKEALEYVAAAKQGTKRKPNIILMDVQMPVIDGYKCTHLLRHHLPYKAYVSDIPIVAMTASAIQGDKEKCKRAGMDDYLAKPVKSKTLERMLLRWLTSRRPTISPPDETVRSDCSEASEECNNADIPVVGVQDDKDVAMAKRNEIYASDEVVSPGDDKSNNLPTPRPINHDRPGLQGDGYFGHDTITQATSAAKSPDREYPTRTLTSPSPTMQASLLNASSNNHLPEPSPEPLPGSIYNHHNSAVEYPPPDGEAISPMNKILMAEMAMQSRDDKLIEVAMAGNSLGHGHAHSYGKEPGDSLTVENVGRLEEEVRKKLKRSG